ncbi:hypothetical protein H8A99_42175 [Bradyrhizobium sp. Arg68]|uniref:hypothetical protein n=1 Tax=Bradyrhizobium ivorense TaxID=2511166 RepID=UPI001E3129A1|nr:hypothetical protein [Bradyrhizobium ivorense]MCC8942846.1 hypothetical protein [Bradyrhizobium ivorense]
MAYKRGARETMAAEDKWLPPREDKPELYTGAEWTETAIEDLRSAWKAGDDLPALASFLCRDWKDVAKKCKERKAGREWHGKHKL